MSVKGNKNALGCKTSGRPAADLVKMAKDLVEWSYLPDSLNLIGFSSPRRISVTKLPAYAEKNIEFRESYLLAKENIAQNRFKASCAKLMPEAFYNRCEGMYDPLYKKYDREEKEFESSLRQKEDGLKATHITLEVHPDLAAGSNISAKKIPVKNNKGSK